ncbi:MAG: hypothetical protein HC802_20570 [Caldilineaceae bacterium]|nr:hypothetical protein [Caldilineaceae bacterium]
MAAISGTAGNVRVGGTAGTVVSKITEWSGDMSYSTSQTAGFGETWGDPEPAGPTTVTGSFSGAHDAANAMHTLLSTAVIDRTLVLLNLLESTTDYLAGSALVTGVSDAQDYNGHATRSYTFEGKKTWTRTNS